MAKRNQTIASLLSRNTLSASTQVIDRLCYPFVAQARRSSYLELTALVETTDKSTLFFLDTNILTSHEIPSYVWEALSSRIIALTPGVWNELTPWRINPRANAQLVKQLNDAQLGLDSQIEHFSINESLWPAPVAVKYYVNLIAQRKRNALYAKRHFIEQNGRDPTATELNTLFQRGYSDRDTPLFRKGLDAIERGQNVFTDEELVVLGVLTALSRGVLTVILTRDHDVFDQFEKLTALLTVHYQAMLFAERFAKEMSSWRSHPMPDSEVLRYFFDVPQSCVVEKPVPPNDFVRWLLPNEWRSAATICVLLGGPPTRLVKAELPYIGEMNMKRLLQVKSDTGGLNTDRLNGRNCHITGFPKDIIDPRAHVLVTSDYFWPVPSKDLLLSLFDLSHAVYHF